MDKIPKKIHYIWLGRWKKSENFEKYLKSWKKYCPDYEIIEWNEDNLGILQNKYYRFFYKKKKWAFASDYARANILYHNGWIYLDTDIELLRNLDELLVDDFFIWFQDRFNIGWAIIWAKKNNPILKKMLEFYETRKNKIILPRLLNKIFNGYWIKKYSDKIIQTEKFSIYPKEYFYPYAYFEKTQNMEITENTYTIHHYDATRLPRITTNFLFPIIRFFARKK